MVAMKDSVIGRPSSITSPTLDSTSKSSDSALIVARLSASAPVALAALASVPLTGISGGARHTDWLQVVPLNALSARLAWLAAG